MAEEAPPPYVDGEFVHIVECYTNGDGTPQVRPLTTVRTTDDAKSWLETKYGPSCSCKSVVMSLLDFKKQFYDRDSGMFIGFDERGAYADAPKFVIVPSRLGEEFIPDQFYSRY